MSFQRNLIALAVLGASSLGALAQTAYAGELRGEIATAASVAHGSSASRDQIGATAAAALAAGEIGRGEIGYQLASADSHKTRAAVSAETRYALAHGLVQRGDA